MAVAKTYANMELQGEPFKESGRWYINVIAPKGIKKVRWYSESEYKRMYPTEVQKNDIMDFNARHVFGFGDLGFITIYKGNQTSLEKCVKENHGSFRRNLTFGYYTPSRLNLCDLPCDVIPIKLNWSDVMDHDDRMKSHEEVQKIIASMIGNISISCFQGVVDDWLQETVVVKAKATKENHFGTKYTYTLEDTNGNLYLWETGAKNYSKDTKLSLKMKVKDHKKINNNEVTIVWYCKEV